MSARFEELDHRRTPIGGISLRRRRDPLVGREVYEIKLDDEFLMSSLFTVAEVALARLALPRAPESPLDVVVGGLGLGYTAQAVLEHDHVRSLLVVEALDAVIDWHRGHLIPAGAALTADTRCRLLHGDFFAMLADDRLDPDDPDRRFHAILVDIDHSPHRPLHPSHRAFYRPAGLRRLAGLLHPGGVFGLWSDDPPDGPFTARLAEVFRQVRAEVVTFRNPLIGGDAANTVYLATT